MSGFSTSERATAWWSTDSRRAVSGKAFDVVAEKIGKAERPDLSEVEHVQMGLRMQDTIAKFAEEELGTRWRALDDATATHPQHAWFKSHGDYISEDRKALLECKNYNAAYIGSFSEPGEPVQVPIADWTQCVHEAACFQVDRVYLAVLFGGQRFRTYCIDVTGDMKEDLVQRMAFYWAKVQLGQLPEPETPEQARIAYPMTVPGVVMATRVIEDAAAQLAQIKANIKSLEEVEAKLQGQIMAHIGQGEVLETIDGRTLATWKQAKGSKRFSPKLLLQSMPDVYNQFVVETVGDRRFLLKGR